jgi:hypothetical protein
MSDGDVNRSRGGGRRSQPSVTNLTIPHQYQATMRRRPPRRRSGPEVPVARHAWWRQQARREARQMTPPKIGRSVRLRERTRLPCRACQRAIVCAIVETAAPAHFAEISVTNSSQKKHADPVNRRLCKGFLRAERRRSRTYPAVGYTTSPVLKTRHASHRYQRGQPRVAGTETTRGFCRCRKSWRARRYASRRSGLERSLRAPAQPWFRRTPQLSG